MGLEPAMGDTPAISLPYKVSLGWELILISNIYHSAATRCHLVREQATLGFATHFRVHRIPS